MGGIRVLSCSCGICGNGGMCCFVWCKLPDDLIIEVLCRLPDKPLVQFKCVSKAWNFLITNICVPRLAASAPLSGFIFGTRFMFGEFRYFLTSEGHYDVNFLNTCLQAYRSRFRPMATHIVGIFNGLVLLSKFSRTPPNEFFVCNPATKQCVSIPVNPKHRTKSLAGIAFDPVCYSPHNNYKIVRMAPSTDKSNLLPSFDVFSSVTGKWGSYLVPLKPQVIGFNWLLRPAYHNGNFYVLSYSKHLLIFHLHATDDDKLSACAIKLPVKARDGDSQNLGLISPSYKCLYYSRDDESVFRIWSLKEGGSKPGSKATHTWILKYGISIDKLRQLPYGKHLSPLFMPFLIDPAADVIYIGSCNVVLKYNLRTKKLNFFRQTELEIHCGRSCFFPYRRSLIVLPE